MSTKHAKKKLKVLYDAGIQDPHVLQLETLLSRATVYRTILSIKAGESLEDAKRSGRPPKLGSDDRRCVAQLVNYSAISIMVWGASPKKGSILHTFKEVWTAKSIVLFCRS